MTQKRRDAARERRDKRKAENREQALCDQEWKRERQDAYNLDRWHRRGLSLDEWLRLSALVDVMALSDPRWREVEFKNTSVSLTCGLASELGTPDSYCYARELIEALERPA